MYETEDDIIQLQNEAQTQSFSYSACVGLYNDINSWRWALGNKTLFINKCHGIELSNLGGRQERGAISIEGWDNKTYILI